MIRTATTVSMLISLNLSMNRFCCLINKDLQRGSQDVLRENLQATDLTGLCVRVKCDSYEDRQERKVVVKTPEEYTQDRAADREDKLILKQVCLLEQAVDPGRAPPDPFTCVRRSSVIT